MTFKQPYIVLYDCNGQTDEFALLRRYCRYIVGICTLLVLVNGKSFRVAKTQYGFWGPSVRIQLFGAKQTRVGRSMKMAFRRDDLPTDYVR